MDINLIYRTKYGKLLFELYVMLHFVIKALNVLILQNCIAKKIIIISVYSSLLSYLIFLKSNTIFKYECQKRI